MTIISFQSKKHLKPSFGLNSQKIEINHEYHLMNGWTNLFCFPKDEYCVSYSELIQRELFWLEICFFFFSILFSKTCENIIIEKP